MVLFWESVLEPEECFFNVAIHGSFESAICIVPVKVDANVYVALPVGLHGVVVPECFTRWRASDLLTYLTPKLSTTRVKEMGLVLWK